MTQLEFRVTFGQKLYFENHPKFAAAHPDGWLSIVASSEGLARDLAFHTLGNEFSVLYHPDDPGYPTEVVYPLGELARINEDDFQGEGEDG